MSDATWKAHTEHGELSTSDREVAFQNIKKAAKHYGVDVKESDWHQLGKHPHTGNSAQ